MPSIIKKFIIAKKTTLIISSMAMALTGCQNIQMAESPIPVTAYSPSVSATPIMVAQGIDHKADTTNPNRLY